MPPIVPQEALYTTIIISLKLSIPRTAKSSDYSKNAK